MEKKHKIIIVALIIVIIALIAGLAFMLGGNNQLSDDNVEVGEGMQVYDFDSAFTMVVKDDAKFLKTWEENGLGISKIYFNEKENYVIMVSESDLVNDNVEKELVSLINLSANYSLSEEGNLKIFKVLDKSDKFETGKSLKHFDYRVLVVNNDKYILLSANDLDLIKKMANSINFE